MPNESTLTPCLYYLVRYSPNTEREEFLNVGILLHSPGEHFMDCLFTTDFGRIKHFHPAADREFLRDLQSYFEQRIQQNEENLPAFIEEMRQSFSHIIQLAPARTILAHDASEQLQHLFERLVGDRRAALPVPDTRMRIKQRLVDELRRADLLRDPRFERHIPAERLTQPGDPLHFDFGYRPTLATAKPDGHLKLIHALSLERDHALASVLSLTMGYVRQTQPAELTAVIEGWPARGSKTARHTFRILEDSDISMRPLAEVGALVASIRSDLAGGNI